MDFTNDDILTGAQDARLELTEKEVKELQQQIEAFALKEGFFFEMQGKDIAPTYYGSREENTLSEDEVENSLPLKKVLLNAPEDDENCFLVPRIIE